MATTVLDFLVPGSGSIASVVGAIWTLCSEMQEAQEACRRLYGRLMEILKELLRLEESGQFPSNEILARYTGTLVKSLQFFTRYRSKSLVSRLTQHFRMMDELRVANEDIDMLMKMLSIATTGMLAEWKRQWEDDCQRQEAMLATVVANGASILDEVRGSRAQQEALLLLQYQFDTRLQQQTELITELMRTCQTALIRATSGGVPRMPKWFLPADEINFEAQAFARGAFGAAHRGVWGSGTKVVVKTLLVEGIDVADGMSESVRQQFMTEIEIWHRLNHPHVLKMYGASHISHPPFIVCEDASLGTLAAYIKGKSTQQHMWQLLHQAALGLEYIHNNGVVHADLKADNILIGADGTARVADFGLSSIKDPARPRIASFTSDGHAIPGGLRWRAPECIRGRPATFQSDVYAFAMCIVETATHQPPFGFLDDERVAQLKQDGQIPERPSGFCDDEWELVGRMAQWEPSGRLPLRNAIHWIQRLAERDDSERASLLQNSTPSPPSHLPLLVSAGVLDSSTSSGVRHLLEQLATTTGTMTVDAVKKLYRLLVTETACVEVASNGGVQLLMRLINQRERSYCGQLYAFACLHILWTYQTNGVSRTELEDSVSQLQEPSASELDALAGWLHVPIEGDAVDEEKCLTAIDMLCCLARISVGHRDKLREQGLLPKLVHITASGTDNQRAAAASALAALTGQNDQNQVAIVDLGGIQILTELVRKGSEAQRWCAASALAGLAGNDANRMFIAHEGAIEPLVKLIVSGSEQEKTCSARALGNLAGYEDNRALIAHAGAIPPLVELLERGATFQKQVATFALGRLATDHDANCESIIESGAIPCLLELVRSPAETMQAYAKGTLHALATTMARVERITTAGGADVLVDLLAVGTDAQKRFVALAFASMAREDRDTGQVSCVASVGAAEELEVGEGDKESEVQSVSCVANTTPHEQTSATLEVIEPLVVMLTKGNSKQKERATIALSNLAYSGSSRVEIARAGAIPSLVALLRDGTEKQKDNACILLCNLAVSRKNQWEIAEAAHVALIALVDSGTELQKEKAAMALGTLAIKPAHLLIVAGGGIEALVKLLTKGSEKQKEQAVTAVGNIAYTDETHSAIVEHGALGPIIKLLRTGREKTKEKAVIAVSNLAFNSMHHKALVEAGAVAPLVELLRVGTAVQKEKAMCALDNLATSDCNRIAIAKTEAVVLLLALRNSDVHRERATRVLTNLAGNASVARKISKKEAGDATTPTPAEVATVGKKGKPIKSPKKS